jgi:heterodisulfide reductase subunit C
MKVARLSAQNTHRLSEMWYCTICISCVMLTAQLCRHVQHSQIPRSAHTVCVLCGFEKKILWLSASKHSLSHGVLLVGVDYTQTDGQTDPYRRSCRLSRNAATKIGKFAGALCDLSLQSRGSNPRSVRVDWEALGQICLQVARFRLVRPPPPLLRVHAFTTDTV